MSDALRELHRRPLWRLLSWIVGSYRPPTAYQVNRAVALETVPKTSGRDDTPAAFAR